MCIYERARTRCEAGLMNKLFVTRRENGGGRVRLLIGVGVGAGSDSGSAWSGSGDAVIVRSGTDARGPGEGTMAGRGESARSGPVGCERPYACQEGDAPTASRPALRDRLHPHPNVRATCACRARVAVVDAYICTALGARHGRRAPHAKCAKQRQVPSEGSRPVSAGGLTLCPGPGESSLGGPVKGNRATSEGSLVGALHPKSSRGVVHWSAQLHVTGQIAL
jgi:hypothetical protein